MLLINMGILTRIDNKPIKEDNRIKMGAEEITTILQLKGFNLELESMGTHLLL